MYTLVFYFLVVLSVCCMLYYTFWLPGDGEYVDVQSATKANAQPSEKLEALVAIGHFDSRRQRWREYATAIIPGVFIALLITRRQIPNPVEFSLVSLMVLLFMNVCLNFFTYHGPARFHSAHATKLGIDLATYLGKEKAYV